MEDFATYILEEQDLSQKMMIAYYLSKKTGIYYDKSIVLRAEIAKMFIEYMKINVDENLVLTAMLLCNCKKIDNAQKLGRLETYATDGANFLSTLGFGKRFCKICQEVNRYSGNIDREVESDILEVVDQFTGLILKRVERDAYSPKDALIILKERNLKEVENRYLEDFIIFINELEEITIKEVIDVPILKKLVGIHNKEANVKTFIISLTNNYMDKINQIIKEHDKTEESKLFIDKDYINENYDEERALFSKEAALRILSHTSKYKLEG